MAALQITILVEEGTFQEFMGNTVLFIFLVSIGFSECFIFVLRCGLLVRGEGEDGRL